MSNIEHIHLKIHLAREYAEITGTLKQLRKFTSDLIENLRVSLNKSLVDTHEAMSSKEMAGIINLVHEGIPELLNSVVESTADRFTMEELEALVAFYKSPIGQSVLSKQASITEDLKHTSSAWQMGMNVKLEKYLEKQATQEEN